ncbi:glycosyltransferase family 4 protein [Paradesertivirga mongoliensis]|uniref:Glycosyltransferase family 4 protein n=1 Tax=Paradesertivirga mongoliensis TaxID=2100740 RepID=A0ABW4ZP33_9SPHI|nr:glycosyltransferase family 4 protein [Pedobacter mongoliensis]
MRIAQIAPLYEAVPPKLYGGTERVVHYLTEQLVKQEHEVTLFASGDSHTGARLIKSVESGLRLKADCIDPLAYHIVQMQDVIDCAHEFDILHFHTDYLHFPFTKNLGIPIVTTLHGRLDIPDLQPIYNKFRSQPVISISKSQQKPLPQANWMGTVYHGLPEGLHKPGNGNGGYLAFVGRISPEKGIAQAIEIAITSQIPLKIAAKIDNADREYYEASIKHLLKHPLIEFCGEINEEQKTDFMGNALALLFPINWAEPFGMVMIEAMACGTPVIAFDAGSVPEIIDDKQSGFIVSSVKEAVTAISKLSQLSRSKVRELFEERFTASRMANNYLGIYNSVINNHQSGKAQSFNIKLQHPDLLAFSGKEN